MSTFRNPVGPEPTRVYWRRRLLVVLGIIAAIVVVVLLVVRPGVNDSANAPETESSETPATSPNASATPSEEAVEGAACDPSVVTLEAITDTNVYAAGQLPQLSFRITNTSGVTCTYDLSATQQSFIVTSGEEQYWSSKDCQVDSQAVAPVLLEPNVPQTSTPIPWDRTRSSATTCDGIREAVPAGGATYNLKVAVGPVQSQLTSFLLN